MVKEEYDIDWSDDETNYTDILMSDDEVLFFHGVANIYVVLHVSVVNVSHFYFCRYIKLYAILNFFKP